VPMIFGPETRNKESATSVSVATLKFLISSIKFFFENIVEVRSDAIHTERLCHDFVYGPMRLQNASSKGLTTRVSIFTC
jgi:hypothetical protein